MAVAAVGKKKRRMLRDDTFGLGSREAYPLSTTIAKSLIPGFRSSGILPQNGRNLFNLTEPEYDGRVPVREVLAGLPSGPAPEIRQASLQERRHFTLADQVNQLAAAREADADMGFMARMMALCSLPRTNPGNRIQYKRLNGPYTLYMTATGGSALPFGNLPRLILIWVCTEAVRTRSRVIVLGPSLSEFMRNIGIYSSDGKLQTRLRNQMKRLFGCSVTMVYKDVQVERFVTSPVAERGDYWWNPDINTALPGWSSTIFLGEALFNEILNHPVPLDMNTLKALKRSPLGLDLYLWLVYRTFTLQQPLRLAWRQLYRQFGVDPARASDNVTLQAFRKDCLRELKKINLAWPGLNYGTDKGVLILDHSDPAIPPSH